MDDELFDVEALERTCIRSNLNGKWGAHTFADLCQNEEGRKALRDWLMSKLDTLFWEEDLHGGKKCSPESWAVNLARLHEHAYGPLVKLRKEEV